MFVVSPSYIERDRLTLHYTNNQHLLHGYTEVNVILNLCRGLVDSILSLYFDLIEPRHRSVDKIRNSNSPSIKR